MGSGVPLRYDEAVIRAQLDALTPEGLLCLWASHKHSTESMQTERWFASCRTLLVGARVGMALT